MEASEVEHGRRSEKYRLSKQADLFVNYCKECDTLDNTISQEGRLLNESEYSHALSILPSRKLARDAFF